MQGCCMMAALDSPETRLVVGPSTSRYLPFTGLVFQKCLSRRTEYLAVMPGLQDRQDDMGSNPFGVLCVQCE